jgi:hypothetical protein
VIHRSALVLALTVAALGASAPAASAGDAWLWVCHGPGGVPLTRLGDRADLFGSATRDCSATGAGLQAPAAVGGSAWVFDMPASAPLAEVRIKRTVVLTGGQSYELRADAPLEGATAGPAATAERFIAASGSQVTLGVACGDDCVAGPGVTANHLAFRVTDSTPPAGSVAGWRSPLSGTLDLEVSATDKGLGLKSATAFVDGQAITSAPFGDSSCRDMTPTTEAIDLPFGLVAQNDQTPKTGALTVGCASRGKVALSLDSKHFANAPGHSIKVLVTDLAGNETVAMDNLTDIDNTASTATNEQTLAIGSGGVNVTPPATVRPPTGEVAGATATNCRQPRLSVELAERPLRTVNGVPVLRYAQPYRFTGSLTCVINGRRRAAPKRTTIDIESRVGRRTIEEGGTTSVPSGKVEVILAYTSSRTIVFRFTGVGDQRDTVRIPIRIARPLSRRAAIHATWFRFVVPRDLVRFTAIEARNVPRGATVRVRCTGPGCPAGFDRRSRVTRLRRSMSVLRGLSGVGLQPGAAVDVTITRSGFEGVGKLYCVRSGQRVQSIAYRTGDPRPACGSRRR